VQLIITEKDNAAKRIADILSDGTADVERQNGVNVYRWGDKRVVGLSGHVVGLDFPEEYSNWRDVEPFELIDADIEKEPTKENIVRTLETLASRANSAVIATDYDREGELIGKEAYEIIDAEMDGPIDRVRFSSITDNEVQQAFAEPDQLDFDLAAAGEARQIIDLIWGAALTRFLSLSARQLGNDFISVGRVQSPTLKLIVDREREIQAFDPETYWELFADLKKDTSGFEAQYFYDDDGKEAERIWDESIATDVDERLREAATATVESVNRRTRTDTPPEPFNTTAFISAAGSLGYSAQRAMSIAEELYTAGYITYPRTDNTVYPEDLEPDSLLDSFVGSGQFGEDAEQLLALDDIEPTRGDEETTDHPPIYPTGELPAWGELGEDESQIYELVVRRFFATVAEAATWKHLRVVAEANGYQLKANGKRLVEEGYHAIYPYASTSETQVPAVEEGEELDVTEVRLEEKETQPPRRYGQSRLIKKMEERSLGTKCLTADSDILVRTDDRTVQRRNVQSAFEAGQVVLADGETDIATAEQPAATLSLDEKTSRIAEQKQSLMSERELAEDEGVLRIWTNRGSFSVTEDHPLYIWKEDGIAVTPASGVNVGEELVTTGRPTTTERGETDSTLLTWEEFARQWETNSKLYGTGCNETLAEYRKQNGESQQAFAERVGAHRPAITRYENNDKNVPVWLLGRIGIRPPRLHGLNYDTTIQNPFPLQWSPTLARIVGSLLGDGSIHIDDTENVVDVRYHNTDSSLIEQFAADIETLFDIEPTITERPGRESHHKKKYQVNLPAVAGRVLVSILDAVRSSGRITMPEAVRPVFIGSLFDDEGHASLDGKLFISNTDHELLETVQEMLSDWGIETKLAPDQHKLHIRGRRDIERFVDTVPITVDEKFYRAQDSLWEYSVTKRKAKLLEVIRSEPKTTTQLAKELDISRSVVQATIRELRADGYVEKLVEGSNRSHDENRTIRYRASNFEQSIYASLQGMPGKAEIQSIETRDYTGPVYDLTVDETAPNFAIQGGIVVHNSTRHHTIEKLYDRGYIESDPPRPTALAEAVVEAAEAFADLVVSDEMTAQLEKDMAAIADGQATLDDVTDESREMLERVFEELRDSREEIADHLQESLKADRRLGPCPDCGEDLLVRQNRQGSYFVGCDGYPDCQFTLPLPNTGEPLVLDETCDEHDTHHVKMLAGRDTFVHGCPHCAAEEADESEDEIIGACPECGEEHSGELAIKQLRSGSRLVGCNRYPDCEYSLPLPRRGDIEITDTYCDEHDLPELHIHSGDEPWELGCPICNYQEYQAEQSIDDLKDIDGIGEKTAEKLQNAGVESPTDLQEVDEESVATEIQGVTADQLREWRGQLAS